MGFVQEAFESNFIAPLGPQVDAFEKEFAKIIGLRHTLALSSGTAAMHLALQVLGVGPGDEVIASTLTFIGSVTPITFLGATPVFIDSDPVSWNMDVDLLEQELEDCQKQGKLPKAVIPTDLYGQCCNYDRIYEICGRYGVSVIVDAAEAVGSKYRTARSMEQRGESQELNSKLRAPSSVAKAGSFIHAGKGAYAAIYSFNGNKIITTSGGGMLASDDKTFIERARKLSQQARDPAPHYEHREIGYNYRMSNVLAALGRGQLRILDERVNKKREIFGYYKEALSDLPGIEFMPEPEWSLSNRWLTVILVTSKEFGADREQIRLALEAENIEGRPVWKPMHLQPAFQVEEQGVGGREKGDQRSEVGRQRSEYRRQRRYPARAIGGEVAEDLFDRGLCLPSGTAMTEEDLDRVVSVIRKVYKS